MNSHHREKACVKAPPKNSQFSPLFGHCWGTWVSNAVDAGFWINLTDWVAFSAYWRVSLTAAAIVSMMTLRGDLPVGESLPVHSRLSAVDTRSLSPCTNLISQFCNFARRGDLHGSVRARVVRNGTHAFAARRLHQLQ